MSYAPLKFKNMKELDAYYYMTVLHDQNLIRKDAAMLSNVSGWLNAIYGKKLWSQLNMEANVFALLPKEPWTQSGIRFKTKRGTTDGTTDQGNGQGGQDAEGLSNLPATLRPVYQQEKIMPKTIWHGFNASELAEFLASVDDAVDIVPQLRQDIGEFHAFQINHMLMKNVDTPSADNIESIQRVAANEDANHSDVSADSDLDIWYQHGARGTAGLDRSGTNTWALGVSGHNNGTDRTLTLSLIDNVLRDVWKNKSKPKVIITGYDTLIKWGQLLEAERRFMGSATVIPTYGGVQGAAPGVEAGFTVSTYYHIPIIPTQAADSCIDTISPINFLDTDFLKFRVAKPTRYRESRDVFALDNLQVEGAYETIGELVPTYFKAQAKLRDLQ